MHAVSTLLLGQRVHSKVVAEVVVLAAVATTVDRFSHGAMAMYPESVEALEGPLR